LTGPQPAAPPFPGQPPTPAPATPRKSRAKWVFGGIVLAMLGIGGCIFSLVNASEGQTEAAEEFLLALDAQAFDAVEASPDTSCFPADELAQIPTNFGGFEVASIQEIRSAGVSVGGSGTTGDVVADVELVSGEVVTAELFMVKNGNWKVCGFDFGLSGGR